MPLKILQELEESITDPGPNFDKKKLMTLQEIREILIKLICNIDTWIVIMISNCPHTVTNTRIEGHYSTTRCLACDTIVNSEPLPGIPYDRD